MLKLLGTDVPSVDDFMKRYRVRSRLGRVMLQPTFTPFDFQMDNPAALHRIKVGVPATVEHSSEAGPETSKWVAETTQVICLSDHLHNDVIADQISHFFFLFFFYVRAS